MILTPYTGQLQLLRELLKTHVVVSLADADAKVAVTAKIYPHHVAMVTAGAIWEYRAIRAWTICPCHKHHQFISTAELTHGADH